MPEETIGNNIRIAEEGDDIIIKINKKHRGGPSGSGKTIQVASTKGNKEFNGIMFGINAYVYPEDKK